MRHDVLRVRVIVSSAGIVRRGPSEESDLAAKTYFAYDRQIFSLLMCDTAYCVARARSNAAVLNGRSLS